MLFVVGNLLISLLFQCSVFHSFFQVNWHVPLLLKLINFAEFYCKLQMG
jgi:hypothetical protein